MIDTKHIIISLGGSLMVSNEVDTLFIKTFKTFIEAKVGEGFKFIIVVGGGRTARRYQDALEQVTTPSHEDKDWMGIAATRLNAEFMRLVFSTEMTHPSIITDPTAPLETHMPVTFAAGWKPGWSTDYVTVLLAKQFGAHKVVNLSNIDYAYTKDPNKFPDAVKIEETTWKEYRKLIPTEWDPGLHTPFDPIASKRADEEGIEVALLNGAHLENFEKYLAGEHFVGTRIK